MEKLAVPTVAFGHIIQLRTLSVCSPTSWSTLEPWWSLRSLFVAYCILPDLTEMNLELMLENRIRKAGHRGPRRGGRRGGKQRLICGYISSVLSPTSPVSLTVAGWWNGHLIVLLNYVLPSVYASSQFESLHLNGFVI
jgi:hypothetical protein